MGNKKLFPFIHLSLSHDMPSSFLPSTTIEIHHEKSGYEEHLREEEHGLLVVVGAKASEDIK
jgi:hypothetical protein